MKGFIPRQAYPEPLRPRHGVRVFVGGCYLRGVGSSFRAKAHAHKAGIICYRSTKWLHDAALAIHELAHVVVGQGHNDKWRDTVIALGGTIDETESLQSYRKRERL